MFSLVSRKFLAMRNFALYSVHIVADVAICIYYALQGSVKTTCLPTSIYKLFVHNRYLQFPIQIGSHSQNPIRIVSSLAYAKSLVNTNSFYTNFTNTHFQKVLIPHLPRIYYIHIFNFITI